MSRPRERDASLRHEIGKKRPAAAPKPDPEPIGDSRAEIRKGRSPAKIYSANPRSGGQERDALACVIRRRRCGVVAVISRDEEQIVLAQRGENGWQSPVELAQCSIEPRRVVSVPEKLVEIY